LVAGNRDAYLAELAMSVNNHAARRAEAGRWAQALATSQEAVDLRRELVAGNRNTYLPDLATSLWNVGYVALGAWVSTAAIGGCRSLTGCGSREDVSAVRAGSDLVDAAVVKDLSVFE
jgi:hypothetical protein